MKQILSLILIVSFWCSINASDVNWKLHPIFDEALEHVVETPDYVYFTSRNLMENPTTESFHSLFRYDKKGEELISLSTSNILNGNNVRDIIYNPDKGYLAVLYNDYNIDFLYNNGSVSNMPAYAQTTLMYDKNVNSMSIDPEKDRLYLATDFGYIAINDKKLEVAESRIYGEQVNSLCRLGDRYYMLHGNKILGAPVTHPRLSLDQYVEEGTVTNPQSLIPINDSFALLISGNKGTQQEVIKVKPGENGLVLESLFKGVITNADMNQNGFVITTNTSTCRFNEDGTYETMVLPAEYQQCSVATNNMSEFWAGKKRKGLSSLKKSQDSWSVTRDWMAPNAPATFVSRSFANHPSLGFLMLSHGYTPSTYSIYGLSPMQLSGYRQGRWTNYAPAYTNPDRTNIMTAVDGITIDPDNNNYVYVSSYHEGFCRLNLKDPNDILYFSYPEDASASKDGFVPLDFFYNSKYTNKTSPYFDNKGNLWILYTDGYDREDPNPHYLCWLAEDRKASTSAQNVRLPKTMEFDVYAPYSNQALSKPLLKTGNGLHIHTVMDGPRSFINIFDTGGTPIDMSDDKVYSFPSVIDQDGNELNIGRVRCILEDPSTGYVWLGHDTGVCYVIPSQVLQGKYQVYRVKVPRNDGTNLADYLLDNVSVNHIEIDGAGRKWFATSGGGVIGTTADGREILEEFNTSNSLMPSDVVYGIGFNSADNSLMISTSDGYVEYNLPGSGETSAKEDIKAYPNPVRPQYSGYVTITDIPMGSFVKITDVHGNLVKELGVMTGFEILWDISDSNFNRVKSGVYHILVSPSDEDSSYSAVGKILVMS